MRNRIRLTTDNVTVGQKVKVGIARWWCNANYRSRFKTAIFWKGKIVAVNHNEGGEISSVTARVKLLKYKQSRFHSYVLTENFLMIPKDGVFENAYLIK